jgi:hypothetical protein
MKRRAMNPTNKYYVCRESGTFQEIHDAEPVNLKGYEGFDFFIDERFPDGWVVTEGKTGLKVTEPGETREEAISKAENKLKEVGYKKYLEAIIKEITENGLSPRYRQGESLHGGY